MLHTLSPRLSTRCARRTGWSKTLCAALVGSAYCMPALAAEGDTFSPFAAISYLHDSNLLRLSEDQLTQFGGDGSDNYRTAAAGLGIDKIFGRQHLTASLKATRVKFDHFSQLDYTGKEGNADLAWALGNHVNGHLGTLYSDSLTPFNDFHDNRRNLRTRHRNYVDGTWRFHPSYQVVAGYSEDEYRYSLETQRYNERTEKAPMIELDYLPASLVRIGIQLRQQRMDYVLNNSYKQDEQKINIYWPLTGTTQLLFLGGRVKRTYESNVSRNASGTNGRMIVNWSPRVRLKFNAQVWKEFSAIEGALVNSSLNKGASVGATWDITAKIRVESNVQREHRDFDAFLPATGEPLDANDLKDNSRSASAGLTYAITPRWLISARAFQEKRNGSVAARTGNYKANGYSITATAQF